MSGARAPRTPSAFQMEQAMAALLTARKRLLENDPEMIADERLFSDMLEGESGNAFDVLHQMCRAALYAKAMADTVDRMIDDLQLRKRRFERRAAWLRSGIFSAMDALTLRRLEQPDFYASIADASVEALHVTNEEELMKDPRFVRVTREINKTAVKEAIKAGEDVKYAELGNRAPVLRLKGG